MLAAVGLLAVACGAGGSPPATSADFPSASAQVNPARIDRVRAELPAGYEVADVAGPVAPVTAWGFGTPWTVDPQRCAVLAHPAVVPETTRGWSGSGPGGIVYAVVSEGATGVDPAVVDECGQWQVSAGRSTGRVSRASAPTIDGAETIAMATATTTVVDGGTETHSHADTVTAYLDGHVAFVAVVTDPGSPNPQLGADFAASLMVKTVAALRG